jgi:3',5'-cyclic AMP phosphodiesterase CpdA
MKETRFPDMTSRLNSFPLRRQSIAVLCLLLLQLALLGCARNSPAQTTGTDLAANVSIPFRFVAYGDSRFHDPRDTDASNPTVRQDLVRAIARAHPAFICFTGDIVYHGGDSEDWKVFDRETKAWREDDIPLFPALGNHEFYGGKTALSNYFQRFPQLRGSRYYSVRAANALILVLDSSLDELSGPQGQWLAGKLDNLPAAVDFVFLMLHHPPYTSSMPGMFGNGGHSARTQEKALAKALEDHQSRTRARFVVFAGHVHNYERHEHGGVTYFVSGGAGAHAYPIARAATDPYQSHDINYHYLMVEVDHQQAVVTMNRLQLVNGKEVWTQPDSIKIAVPAAASVASH